MQLRNKLLRRYFLTEQAVASHHEEILREILVFVIPFHQILGRENWQVE